MPPIDYKRYPENWKTEIRPAVLSRDNHRCKFCGVKNYAVGYYNGEQFELTGGNKIHDAAGSGRLPYKEAADLVKHINEWSDEKYIVIVLTIAHLDHDEENVNVSLDRLAALCQRCHLRYDAKEKSRRRKHKNQLNIYP